jgi:hypothetical protein
MKNTLRFISWFFVLCLMIFGVTHNAAATSSAWLHRTHFFLNPASLFGWIAEEATSHYHYMYQTSHCANSLEIPLWDNPTLKGEPKRYSASAPRNPDMEGTFLFDVSDDYYSSEENQDQEQKRQERQGTWWTSTQLNGKNIFEYPAAAQEYKVKSWPIRAVVLATNNGAGSVALNTIHFTPTGQAIEGYNKKLKTQVSLTCGQLFLLDERDIETPLMEDKPSLSYLPTERRLCNFYPNSWPEFMFTEGSLEEHRKNLLTYCKGGFSEAESRPNSQLPTSIKDVDPPQLQSFIPSELDLTKPIDKTSFVLTIRFEDPVQPVYHKAFPKVCLADCPQSGAKQIQGIELKREGEQ